MSTITRSGQARVKAEDAARNPRLLDQAEANALKRARLTRGEAWTEWMIVDSETGETYVTEFTEMQSVPNVSEFVVEVNER